MSARAVVLDFDGVVLQSVGVKTRAFEALFASEPPALRRRIVDYHLANGGLSRFEKFRWAYREVLRRPLSGREEEELGRRFNRLVEDGVVGSEWVPGAEEFLVAQHRKLPIFVASGTPEDELRRVIERRGIGGLFREAYGSPASKEDILRRVAEGLGAATRDLLMVGDSVNDQEAARAAGARFVGVVPSGSPSPFPPEARTLPDLRGLALLL